ncbi:MAG TPA: aspartyl protease family protein, partial [Aggregatilineales bacterium]|nr:aspartyl protease family protein [Aggregatilineales bacterium]
MNGFLGIIMRGNLEYTFNVTTQAGARPSCYGNYHEIGGLAMVLQSPGSKDKMRADIIAEMERAQAAFDAAPENAEARYLYANLLHISGEFWKAWEVAKVFCQESNPSLKAQALAARLAFLLGDYATAERLYGALATATKHDPSAYVSALVSLMFTYHEQNRFDAIKALQFPAGVKLPQHKAITAFEGQPYTLEWSTNDKVSIVPFVMTDPLPLLMVEVNRVPLAVFFDTGADTLIIDPDIAQALGIESTATAKTPFGGGLEAEFGFGQVASLKLGDVTMRNVPVTILPSKRFSDVYKNKGIILGGIVGTAMLRQFLATVDYEHGRFVLRERTISSLESVRQSQREKDTVAIP